MGEEPIMHTLFTILCLLVFEKKRVREARVRIRMQGRTLGFKRLGIGRRG
jgi:hypothetical protein